MSVKVPRIEERDKEFGTGAMTVENFWERITTESSWSEPILVEGRAWRLLVEAYNKDSGEEVTHISVYLNMVSIEDHLNLDLPS